MFHQFQPPNGSFDIVNSGQTQNSFTGFQWGYATGGWLAVILDEGSK
jgi:hypothetical protein